MAGATPSKDSEATARAGCRAEETERREENEEDEGEVREEPDACVAEWERDGALGSAWSLSKMPYW